MTNQIRTLDTNFGIVSMKSALEFADVIIKTQFCPACFLEKNNGHSRFDVATAILTGMELGLSPLNSLRCICVIKGTPTIWGTVKNALAIKSGNLVKIDCEYFGKEYTDEWGCRVTVHRKNPEMSFAAEFSYADAKRACLLDKNNWKYYPKKMLYNRAKQTALNEAFAELFYNIYSNEEIEDLPMRNITPEQETQPVQLTKQQEALAKCGWAKEEIQNKYREALKEEPLETGEIEEKTLGTKEIEEKPQTTEETKDKETPQYSFSDNEELINNLFSD